MIQKPKQQPVKMSIRLPREIHKILSYAVVDGEIESINQEVVDLLTKKWMREEKVKNQPPDLTARETQRLTEKEKSYEQLHLPNRRV